MIKVYKDRFRKGYHSVHEIEYRNGKLVYDKMIDYFKSKKDADTLAKRLRETDKKGSKITVTRATTVSKPKVSSTKLSLGARKARMPKPRPMRPALMTSSGKLIRQRRGSVI